MVRPRQTTAPALVAGLVWLSTTLASAALAADSAALIQELDRKATGDLPQMQARGQIRVLVTYNLTNFFVVQGQTRGFEYELLREYEQFLNQDVERDAIRTRLLFIPLPFDELLPALVEGRGDIAAAGITITPERLQRVAFTDPYVPHVDEIVVTARRVTGLKTVDDLAGRTVRVVRSSSYAESLRQLDRRLRRAGRSPITIVEAADSFETEDLLELTNAAVVHLTIADRHLAELWASVLPDIVVRDDLAVRTGGRIAWAVRQDSRQLRRSLNAFIKRHKRGTLLGNVLFKRYYENRRWITNPLDKAEHARLEKFRLLFKKYGAEYGIDWVALAAQAYQESGLDQSRRSSAGAIGVMQVRPATATDPNVNIPNITNAESNIHAGTKYLAFLRKRYFSGPELSPQDRIHFSLAAYNAGPARVAQFRKHARAMGLDPNTWFSNVELAALKLIGPEPVRYVSNIHKYYIAYKFALESIQRRQSERSTIAPAVSLPGSR